MVIGISSFSHHQNHSPKGLINIELFGFQLLNHEIILIFNDPEIEGFRKHCGKRRKCWKPAFSPFPTIFSTLSERKIIISVTFISSSANVFSLVQSKILLCGKELNNKPLCQIEFFIISRNHSYFLLQLFSTHSQLLMTPNKKDFRKRCGKRRK